MIPTTSHPGGRRRLAFAALLLPILLSACGSGSDGPDAGVSTTGGATTGDSSGGNPTPGGSPALGAASPEPVASGGGDTDPPVNPGTNNPFEVPEPGAAVPSVPPSTDSTTTPVEPVVGAPEPDREEDEEGIVYCD